MPDIFVAPKREVREQEVSSGLGSEVEGEETNKPHPHSPRPNPSLTSHPPPHPMSPLAAFADHPKGFHFATQVKGEEVELFLRRHFITNVPWIVSSMLLFILPPVVLPIVAGLSPFPISMQLGVILLLFWYIAVFGLVTLSSFVNWYFNVYIVTNGRVIDVDFINLLYREVSATRLNLIQDVTVKTGGVIRAIFHYGDVFIQTAGTEVNFDFHAVPRPELVAQTIERLMREARLQEGESELEKRMKK